MTALLLLVWMIPFQVKAGSPATKTSGAKCFVAPPNWSINPDDFEFNMSLVVRIKFNSIISNNAGNIVGVFVGNELRGVATPVLIAGDAFYFITAYSNLYTGETLHFRAYYAPNDAVFPTPETVNFIHNSRAGTIELPFFLNIDPNADFPPELEPILADTTLQNIPFDPIALADYLNSPDGDPVTWTAQAGPNLTATIVNGILTVTPVSAAWIGSDSVRIIVTENTPAQLADTITGWFTVLEDYGPPVWLNIPDQTIFSGAQFSSFDLDDYLDFDGPCRQFDFDVFPFTGNAADPAWPPVLPPITTPMNIVARPLFADVQLGGTGSKLAAFVNGVRAGWASATGVPPNVSYALVLENVGPGNITFQFYDAANQYLYEEVTGLAFAAGANLGSIAAPYLIQLSPLIPALDANGVLSIAIDDPSWLGTYPIDFIVWDCNYPDIRRDSTQALFTITDDIRPQITSEATVNFEENACAALYDTEASDPNDTEGAGLTYALAGGADVLRFSIDPATGILSWAIGFSPDFEAPADANTDNKYEVNIQVTNSASLSDVLSLTVMVTNQSAEPFAVLINGGLSPVCSTGSVSLQATGGISHLWNTGATTATIVVNNAGTYTVTGTSTGACTATATVVVAAPPTISASGNTPVCLGAPIELSSTPAGGTLPYATFAWTGPNNYSANVEDPAGFPATALSGGTYTVTVTDAAGCTASATKSITVTANASPTITASSNTPVCLGINIQLSSSPAGGSGTYTQFNWSGPNNYTGSGQNPTAFASSLPAAGIYQVTVTDNAGCKGTASTTVAVKPSPAISASSNSPVCVGSNVLLTSTPSGGSGIYTQFSWAGPNGFSALVQNPAAFAATLVASGTYTVTVTDNGGCSATKTTSVSVNGLPAVTAGLLAPVCTNGTVALGATASGGSGQYAGYQWSGPNNYVANVKNPAAFPVTPLVGGNYFVTVTDVAGCTASSSVAVVVHTLPSISASNNGPVCEGSNISLSSTPSAGSGIYSGFLWSGPDAYVASVEDPVPFSTTIASAGIYQVKVTDSNGCTATASTTVTVHQKPSLSASSNSPLCLGANLNLQSSPGGGSGVYTSFSWTGPAAYTAATEDPAPFAVTLANAGTYRVTVTDNAGCTATASTSVAVSTLNAPSITAGSNSPVCGGSNLILNSTASGGSGIFSAFSWSGPNAYTSTLEDPAPFAVFAPNAPGIYTVTVTDSKSCKGTASVSVIVTGPTVNASSNSPVCPNGTILLNGGPFIAAGVTYAWSGPNNYTSILRIPPGIPATPAAAGTYILTITENGCSGRGTISVAIEDLTPPVIVCPGNKIIAANASCNGVVGAHTATSVSDNCAANPTVSQSPAASTALSGHNDSETVKLTANDGNGNTASCSFTVTLKDQTAPVLTCPANNTIAADATCSGTLGAYAPVSVSDNCAANPVVSQSPAAATVLSGHNDLETVTLSAADGNGNTGICTFTVTLKDITKPVITCPANTTVAADANCSSPVGAYAAVSVSDNCNPNPAVSQSPVAATLLNGHNDVEIITLTANDGNGNTQFCTFTVTLKDVTKPSITCPANTTLAADANCSSPVGAYLPVAVSDNCTLNPVVAQSPVSSTLLTGHNDVETLTLTADDGNGNTQFCTFTVTLKDVTKPVITCPANTTVAADANCAGVVGAYVPIALSDNCNPNPAVSQNPAAATVLTGHNDVETLTLTADDGNGNTQFCSFTVTLKDVTKPSITCPANTTVAADANCSAPVGAYTAVSVSDNCNPNPAVTQSPGAATVLSGHNDVEIITLTANDGNGNTQICTFTVTLKDITKPLITCPANTTLAADANCSSPVGAYTAASVSDNCTANPLVTQSPVPATLLSGHNDVETITLTANDGNGNTQFCSFTVTLKDITAPSVVCKPFSAALNAAGMVSITTANVFQSGADNCGVVNQVSVIPNAFTCSNLGPNTVVLTVNDGNGNTATCNATVTVVDLIPPTMVCKQASVWLNSGGTATITVTDINNNSSDNCTLFGLTLAPTSFSCANLGANSVTLTGSDQSGNTSSCQSTVTVIDTIKPTLLCRNATIDLNAIGQAALTVAAVNNGSFDNCTITSFTLSQSVFTCANLGNNVVTLTGTDQSGNSASCTASVTVRDLIAPMAKCKNFTANLNASGNVTVLPADVNNASTDNCSFTLSVAPAAFTCANIGMHTVTLTATDNSGNTNTCTSRVTVKDITPPTALCKNLTLFLNDQGKVSITVAQVDNGSSDNCSIASRTLLLTDFNCGDIAAPLITTMTVKDGSGNSSICNATITVKDNLAPTAVCSNTTVVLGLNGTVSVPTAPLVASSFDNCAITTITPVSKTYTNANLGNNNLVITVKDWTGNSASCTSIVTVLPNGPSERPSLADGKVQDRAEAEEHRMALDINPNPTNGQAVLTFNLPAAQSFTCKVYDLNSRPVLLEEGMGASGKNVLYVQMGSLPAGLYFVEVYSEGLKAIKRLILQH